MAGITSNKQNVQNLSHLQMPRKYTRKTDKASWTATKLKAALKAIEDGRSIREVSKAFNIPRSTIQDRLRNKSTLGPSLGRKPVFSTEVEKELADQIKKLSKIFYGITPLEVKQCAYTYAQKNHLKTPFTQQREKAGRDWLEGFLKRNSDITLRKPEATSVNRIHAFNEVEVATFYSNLSKLMEKYGFTQSRIFNADETGITTVQRPGRIYAEKGQKRVGYATSWERGKTTTVMCAFSASGFYIPPMFIYARKRMTLQLKRNGPPEAIYLCSDNGWINANLFLEWLQHFKKFTKSSKEDPTLLILDNHVSHCTLEAYNFCREHGIILLTIPLHTSHRIQPLDVTFYAPLKAAYNSECDKYMKSHVGEKITSNEVAELFKRAFSRVATPEKALKGFQVTGIFPLNPDIFTEEDYMPDNLIREQTPEPDIARRINSENVINGSHDSDANISFCEIIPIPGCLKSTPKKLQTNSRKQHSEIFTATPMKDILEQKESNKTKRLADKTRREENAKRVKRNFIQEERLVTKKVHEKSYLECRSKSARKQTVTKYCDEKTEEFADSETEVTDDICLFCGEFGKNNELWLRCILCEQWAHKACSGCDLKTFVCDFCE